MSNQNRRNNKSNDEAAEMCCSRAQLVYLSPGIVYLSIGRHIETRTKASPKCRLEATEEFRAAVTNHHTGRSM
jgi:hypothetical protein